MKLSAAAFTEQGERLAEKIAEQMRRDNWDCTVTRVGRTGNCTLAQFTQTAFESSDALLFVGAVGIAVRAVAPHLNSKASDPAVLSVDELGRFVIPLAGGHIGGGNRLAERIAEQIGATPVVTTATDINGVFAVDSWAVSQKLVVMNPPAIKRVSSALLAGQSVSLFSAFPVSGELPAGVRFAKKEEADVVIDLFPPERKEMLFLVPKALVLGIGCRKGISEQAVKAAVEQVLSAHHLPVKAVCGVYSIDLKAEEPGLTSYCKKHGFPFQTFSAEQLAALKGAFSASAFVCGVTGVDNVCERSAVLGSGGTLLVEKQVCHGVTVAAAACPVSLSF